MTVTYVATAALSILATWLGLRTPRPTLRLPRHTATTWAVACNGETTWHHTEAAANAHARDLEGRRLTPHVYPVPVEEQT